jgi:predicted transcriptional regulator
MPSAAELLQCLPRMMHTKVAVATMMRVREVMRTPVIQIDADSTVWDAALKLTEHRISGAPVSKGSRILGMVTKSDLVDPKNELQARVDKVMTPFAYAVKADDPVMLAIKLMVDENIHRALVVDNAGELVGIVAPIDICRALRHGKAFDEESHVDLRYVDLARFSARA